MTKSQSVYLAVESLISLVIPRPASRSNQNLFCKLSMCLAASVISSSSAIIVVRFKTIPGLFALFDLRTSIALPLATIRR